MTELAMKRQGNNLVPVDEVSSDELKLIPQGQEVLITAKVPRNLKQFRLAWALAQKVSEAVDFLPDREAAMDWLKIKSRHVKVIQDPRTGEVVIIPKSIAFGSQSQASFTRMFNRMVWVVCNEIIPGLDESMLRREIEQMVNPAG